MIELSVLLCTYNPRPDYLAQVLAALQKQTLARERWELLLIDNASDQPLLGRYDLGWHQNSSSYREEKIGKINALLLGFRQSHGAVLVIVDDDNVLAPDYLANALTLADQHPRLGAWGGNVTLKFETPPPAWTEKYWGFLAQQKVETELIQIPRRLSSSLPVGAGCCVRRSVVDLYVQQIATSEWRQLLGRTGKKLMAGEDSDLVMTAADLELQCGVFPSLNLTHLIPPYRLEEAYMIRLMAGIQFSSSVLEMCRDPKIAPPPTTLWWWVKYVCDCAFKFGRKRRFYQAYKTAQRDARRVYDSLYPST